MSFVLSTFAQAADPRTEGGMVNWPRAEMRRALEIIVPERMEAMDVPGLAMAVVKDGEPIFVGGFGFADRRYNTPIDADTLFEAGSLGDVITAYGAMSMVRDKLLFLDAPLSRDLTEKWLKSRKEDEAVTLRLVLSHMSGLGDNAIHPAHRLNSEPGTQFLHSGEGYVYLQHAMQSVGQAPFESLMQARVFEPLSMTRSTFMTAAQNHARGHVPLSYPIFAFFIPFALGFVGGLVLTFLVLRFVYDTHRLEIEHLIFPLAAAIIAAVATVWLDLGFAMMLLVLLMVVLFVLLLGLVAFVLATALAALGIGGGGDGVVMRGRRNGSERMPVFIGAVTLLVALPLLQLMLPVMRLPFGQVEAPNAALTFQTSARDMSAFMIGLMEGEIIGKAMTGQFFAQQVRLGPDRGWALGLGLQRNQNRITYWEGGATTGYESLMVLEPARATGLVVLTNSREGAELAQQLARDIFGIESSWELR